MKHKKLKEEETEQIINADTEVSRQAEDEKPVSDEPGKVGNKETEELKKQVEDNYNRLLRMQADFDNYKKRVAKERDDMYSCAVEAIAGQLLPVVDNMERALEVFRKDQLDEQYICGVEMVCKQLIGVLEKNGIKEIEALERDFDPNVHHAVMREPGGDEDENKVKEVFQKGYILGNRVIRPALVKVSVKQ